MEQTKSDKQQTHMSKPEVEARMRKLNEYNGMCYEKLTDIRNNIIKVRMELYSSENEHIATVWNLCDKLRELIYNENKQTTHFNKNTRKYVVYEQIYFRLLTKL